MALRRRRPPRRDEPETAASGGRMVHGTRCADRRSSAARARAQGCAAERRDGRAAPLRVRDRLRWAILDCQELKMRWLIMFSPMILAFAVLGFAALFLR